MAFLKRMFRPAIYPERPPQGWDNLPPHPGYKELRFPSQEALNAEVARRKLGTQGAFNKRNARAAVDPNTFEYLKLEPHLYVPGEEAEVDRHERVHMYGGVHAPNGHDWLDRDGKPLKPPTQRDIQRMQMEAAMRKGANVFAQAEPPRVAGPNIFRGR